MLSLKEYNENYTDAELDEIEFNLQNGFTKNIKYELSRIGRSVSGLELSDVFYKRDGVQPEIQFIHINDEDDVAILDIFGREELFLYLIGSYRICTFYAREILSSLRKITSYSPT
jgi:hypothetical protein